MGAAAIFLYVPSSCRLRLKIHRQKPTIMVYLGTYAVEKGTNTVTLHIYVPKQTTDIRVLYGYPVRTIIVGASTNTTSEPQVTFLTMNE